MRYKLLFVLALSFSVSVFAQEADADLEKMWKDMQRDDYIKVYLMITSPGNEAYSVAGHAAIRMICPTKDVDYCYEYTADVSIHQQLDYVIGNMTGTLCRHHTSSYMRHYTELGRGITALLLNLTPEQEVNLWSELDSETDNGGKKEFSVMGYNCASVLRLIIESSLDTDVIKYHNVNPALLGTYRDIFPYVFGDSPWIGLLWNIMNGTDFDKPTEMVDHLFPVALLDEWSKSTIISIGGNERPMVLGKNNLTEAQTLPSAIISPIAVWILLLLIVILSAIIDWLMGYTILGKITDVTLMMIETIVGIFLTYLLVFSHQVATSWNWLIIIFSPIPLFFWLIYRGKKTTLRNFCRASCYITAVYVLFSPFIP